MEPTRPAEKATSPVTPTKETFWTVMCLKSTPRTPDVAVDAAIMSAEVSLPAFSIASTPWKYAIVASYT